MEANLFQELLLDEFQKILANPNLSLFIKNQVKTILDCRTLNLGGHIYLCPDEHGGLFLYNSCRKRGCSVCMEYEQRKWFLKKKPLLFPVKHHHLVFKLPSQLATIWLYNKSLIPKIMFDAAHEAIKKVNIKGSLKRGWISVLHTWGSYLSYHPHVHILLTDGGLDKNDHWQDENLSIHTIRTNYNEIIVKKILKALKKNKLLLPPGIDSDELVKIVNKEYFYMQQFGTYSDGKGVLLYLSNKLKVGALNHRQVIAYNSETVTFKYERERKTEVITLKREEFIKRYLNHIPPKGLMMVRSCGIYSVKHKAKTLELKEKLFGIIEEEPEDTSPHFKCPICSKELRIVVKYNAKEFKNSKELKRLGYPGRPPPKHMEFIKFESGITQ